MQQQSFFKNKLAHLANEQKLIATKKSQLINRPALLLHFTIIPQGKQQLFKLYASYEYEQ